MKLAYTFVIADLLHFGHLRLLEAARAQADRLVCGVLTDEAVSRFKRPPIATYRERSAVIAALRPVDEVMPQDSQDPTDNLKALLARHPGCELVFAHGDHWASVPGRDFLESVGARRIALDFYPGLSNEAIARKTIAEALPGAAALDTFTPGFSSPSFTVFRKEQPSVVLTTKAKTLQALKPLLKRSRIEKTYVFTVGDWRRYPQDVIAGVRAAFPQGPVVVRSSRLCEDCLDSARAGRYRSELDVDPHGPGALEAAVGLVIASYGLPDGPGEDAGDLDQVLVQAQTRDIAVSGVVFTAELKTNAPYYVINHDRSGRSDVVTAGLGGELVRVFRKCPPERLDSPFREVLAAVQEIESIVPGYNLDIEFAVDGLGEVVIFQVRPLAANARPDAAAEARTLSAIRAAERQYARIGESQSLLPGEEPVFSDMLLWNPAELIGHRPSELAVSLFGRLIMDSAWNQGLTPLGYPNLFPEGLMERFLYKPYIKVNTAFRALIPACVGGKTREKLVRFCLDKLRRHPELHDKAEFDIMFSCWDFDTPIRLAELADHGFTRRETADLQDRLVRFTRDLLRDAPGLARDIAASAEELAHFNRRPLAERLETLGRERNLFQVNDMLERCERLGARPFCTAARLAFVAGSFLRGLERAGVIGAQERELVTGSFPTVASRMTADTAAAASGTMDFEEYRDRYGHLRSGTYDIEKKRYGDIISPGALGAPTRPARHPAIPSELAGRIDQAAKASPLATDFNTLMTFIREFTQAREQVKFVFTRTLSDVLELIRAAAAMQGLAPSDAALLDCAGVFSLFTVRPEALARRLEKAKATAAAWESVILPPLIFGKGDLRLQRIGLSRPNFITLRAVRAGTATLKGAETGGGAELSGRIVFVENADPGYHWLFSRGIAGLVTKYGGANSHMAICCAELEVPAAIGCGEAYEELSRHAEVTLDCANHVIRPEHSSGL